MTQNDGKSFESRIHFLLGLQGVDQLTTEKQLGSKKADLTFEITEFGGRIRYAVECKDYSHTIGNAEISAIRSQYHAAMHDRIVDRILVVSKMPLSPTARTYVDSIDCLSYMTENDLVDSLIDFRGYLFALKSSFESDSALGLYVRPRVLVKDSALPNSSSRDLMSVVNNLILEQEKPIAILGAYGIGKTTFAKQLFLDAYANWERDTSMPIPIYISLDRMAREQTLDGLLGTLFSKISNARGYNFETFCALNRMRRFLLILDGLDEMRHKLGWEEFQYNLDQLAILTAANPKSVLLGVQRGQV